MDLQEKPMSADHQLLDLLPVAVYATDADGYITYFNEAAASMWGHRPVLGADKWCGSWRLFWPDGRPLPHDECPMAVAIKQGLAVRNVSAILERPDGVRIPFAPYPTPLKNENGDITGGLNVLIDLTARQRGDLEAAKLAAIVSSSDDAIVSKGLDGIITSWNQGATNIFGYSEDEMIGTSIMRIIPEELRSEEAQIIAKLRAGERVRHFETARVTKDGRRIDVSLTISPILDWAGRVVGASKVARDITDKKQSEEMRKLLTNELDHRVKNTLATVQSIASHTLRESENTPSFVKAFSGRVQALAKAHSLLTGHRHAAISISEILWDQVLLGAQDSRISLSGPAVNVGMQETMHLSLIFHELATNARKYGALSQESGRLSVEWSVYSSKDRTLKLEWKESSAVLNSSKDTGFGSVLIQKTVEAHGGTSDFELKESGLKCLITFPLTEQLAKPPALPRRPDVLPFTASDTLSEKQRYAVLLVEDEPIIAMDMEEILSEAGHTVVGHAPTLENARQLVQTKKFDIAVLDINLGGLPVDEIAAELTQRSIPFAFTTGYGAAAIPKGFHHVVLLRKPFNPDQLLSVIQAIAYRPASAPNVRQLRPTV
jgi:PAS domain S-box-containing protein